MRMSTNTSRRSPIIEVVIFIAASLALTAGCSSPGSSSEDAEDRVQVASGSQALSTPQRWTPESSEDAAGAGPVDYEARNEECCSGPGHITECWLADAQDDGVICKEDEECPSNRCDTDRGLCICSSDAECNDGVCTDDGVCGPSWCNGYRLCSCWGGCEKVGGESSYASLCVENGMSCCEGTFLPLNSHTSFSLFSSFRASLTVAFACKT